MKLNAALGAGGLVERTGRDEFVARHNVGRQTNFDDRRGADAQAGGIDGGSVRVFAKLSGVETENIRGSRREEALIVSGFGFRVSSFSLLTSAAMNLIVEQRPAERRELAIQGLIGRIPYLRRGRSEQNLHVPGQFLFLLGAPARLPLRRQRAGGDHGAKRAARLGLRVEMPDTLVAEAVGVRIARQYVG